MSTSFKALEASEQNGKFSLLVREKKLEDLPEGDLLIKVEYSSLNPQMKLFGFPKFVKMPKKRCFLL